MKLKLIAAAALFTANQAQALSPVEVADPSVVKIYASGASALRNVIGGLFTQNCTADLSVYFNASGTFGGAAFSGSGGAHRVYACTMRNTSPILPGRKVALFKSDIGGSGQGIFPVFFGAVAPFPTRTYLNVSTATCSARQGSVPNYTCSGEIAQVPMFGLSDAEPSLFTAINVPPDDPTYPVDGLTTSQLSQLTITPLFQTVFGVAVNKSLRDALQAKQGLIIGMEDEANSPSMSRIEAAAYFNGGLQDPDSGLGWQPIVSNTDSKRATRVNICRRVNGSGTQAAANAFLSGFPCLKTTPGLPLVNTDSSIANSNAIADVGPAGSLYVYQGSSTGNVISCLNQAETSNAYAIGHVSKENSDTGTNWRHVRVDGIAPSRDNVKAGKYEYFFESTLQYHNSRFAGLSADQRNFITAFAAEASKPASLALLPTATQNGVAALPESFAGAFATGSAAEIAFGSRVTRGGLSCTAPFYAK